MLDDFVQQLIDDFGKVQHATNAKSIPQVKERSGSLGFSGITGDVNQRIENVKSEIKELIPVARQSVAEEIAQSNRDKVLLALVNFLGGMGKPMYFFFYYLSKVKRLLHNDSKILKV